MIFIKSGMYFSMIFLFALFDSIKFMGSLQTSYSQQPISLNFASEKPIPTLLNASFVYLYRFEFSS